MTNPSLPADLIVNFECPLCKSRYTNHINLCNNMFLPLVQFFSDSLVCPDCGVNASGIYKLVVSDGKDSFTIPLAKDTGRKS